MPSAVSVGDYFSRSYAEARRRFRDAAGRIGASIESLPLECRGLDGVDLTIDIAWVGSKTPRHVLMHCTGIHGVEGFTGSAIQLRILEELGQVEGERAVILVHVMNPYGMAWLRRFNERNVDLNRNWLEPNATWTGTPEVYRNISGFLNPTVIRPWDAFYLRAVLVILKYGMGPLRKAIAGGQYGEPKGLFYGGNQLEEGPTLFRTWLQSKLSSISRLFVLDVHTGLGKWRQNALFYKLRSIDEHELPREITANVVAEFEKSDVVGYEFRGGHVAVYQQLFPDIPLDFLTQEFGTYPGVRMLKALRAENYQHHHADQDVNAPNKKALKDAFCPPSDDWRAGVLEDGLSLFLATRDTVLAQRH